jgi:sorbitol-specific phosphotransferase system component IIA
MTPGSAQSKISAGLASRLKDLEPGDKVRVVVLLRTRAAGKGRRTTPAGRDAAVKAVKESARTALGEVDAILERFEGRRLSSSPNALGAITVKATAPAIRALARSAKVRAIMEDQAIRLVF